MVFKTKFAPPIADKAINAVRLSDFLNVCDAIHARAEYAAPYDFASFRRRSCSLPECAELSNTTCLTVYACLRDTPSTQATEIRLY